MEVEAGASGVFIWSSKEPEDEAVAGEEKDGRRE